MLPLGVLTQFDSSQNGTFEVAPDDHFVDFQDLRYCFIGACVVRSKGTLLRIKSHDWIVF